MALLKVKSRTQAVEYSVDDFVRPHAVRRVGDLPNEEPVAVYIRRGVMEQMFGHARSRPNLEVGGYLFGHAYVKEDRAIVQIEGAFCITSEEASLVSFRFLAEDSARAERYQTEHYPSTEIVGWYHTHPGHGIFLSSTDVETQLTYFKLFHRIAIVVDPQRREFGAFVIRDGEMHALGSLFVVEEDNPGETRPALAVSQAPLPPPPSGLVNQQGEIERTPTRIPPPPRESADLVEPPPRRIAPQHEPIDPILEQPSASSSMLWILPWIGMFVFGLFSMVLLIALIAVLGRGT